MHNRMHALRIFDLRQSSEIHYISLFIIQNGRRENKTRVVSFAKFILLFDVKDSFVCFEFSMLQLIVRVLCYWAE